MKVLISMRFHSLFLLSVLVVGVFVSTSMTEVHAQTTSFTYQGRLSDGGNVANGSYDLQFALWDSLSGGAQIGATQTVSAVAVSNGIFTVSLDFGANAFTGANRWLETSVRLAGSGALPTVLSPRQPITSTPYSVRSLSAASVDTVPVNAVPPGSGNYIQNSTKQQASSNFNISGLGFASGFASKELSVQTNDSACAVAVIGWGSPVSYFCADTLAVTTSDSTRDLISGYAPSGRVFKLNGTGDMYSAGSLGIGTTAPQSRLHVNGTGWFTGNNTRLPTAAGSGVAIGISGSVGYLFGYNYGIDAPLTLALNGPGGSVGIGTTTPARTLEVAGNIRVFACVENANGTSLTGSSCSSDIRFKRDIKPFPNLLNRVVKLQPVNYYWRTTEFPEKRFGTQQSYGLVAQEVERVLPELVGEDKEGFKTVDYSKLPLMMLQAMKEQQTQIEQQQKQLKQQQEQIERERVQSNAQLQQLNALKNLVCRSHRRATVCK